MAHAQTKGTSPQKVVGVSGAASDTTARPKTKTAKKAPPPGRGSKIVDDSTKNIYGPKTTLWTTERDIFLDRPNYRPLDTTLNNFHRWTAFHQLNYTRQDLGNNGTALNPIFPLVDEETIGVSPGIKAYRYYFDSKEPIFFNTKSPYTRMYLVWGGQGRATTRAEYSRNINPRWNFGINYHPILTNKQVQRRGKSDYQVVSHYYDAYTHYMTKDSSYSVLASYRRIRHRVFENGGVNPVIPARLDPDTLTFEETYPFYFNNNASPKLTAASSTEQRNQLHVFQQYRLGKTIQVYHMGDLARQMNWFKEDLTTDVTPYYDNRRIDTTAVKVTDSTRFSYIQNQVGMKGYVGKSKKLFFNAYYKIKSYNLFYKYLNVDTLALSRHSDEHYGGGQLTYFFDSIQQVSLNAQRLEGGYYRYDIQGATKWIDFMVRSQRTKPNFLTVAYNGHFDFWSNEFKAPESIQASVFPKVTLGPLFISPGITYTDFSNYIYFAQRDTFPGTNQKVMPVQSRNRIKLAVPELRLDLRLPGNIHIRPQVMYTRVLADKDSALSVPKLFFNGQLAFENFLFKKNLQVQIGVDVHWHTAYKAMGYDPAIQTFYIQQKVTSPDYLLADLFFNGKMKRGRFFIKYHNILQFFSTLKQEPYGHMPTPYYKGMRNVMDFGFDLLLFD